jgi:hypothetical protein
MAMEMHTEGTTAKKGGAMRHGRHERRARGGAAKDEKKINEYNAQGSPEVREADDEEPGFKKGGARHKERKAGGEARGERGMKRHDMAKRGRGHEMRKAGGRAGSHSPYSSGRTITMGGGNDGHEGQKVPAEPD